MKSNARPKEKGLLEQIISSFKDKSKMDVELLIIILLMTLFGLIMVASASSITGLYRHGDSLHFLKTQAIVGVGGFLAMLFVSKIDYHIIASKQVLKPAIVITCALMLFAAFGGQEINGARRWIGIGGFTIQPSELAKIVWVVWFAKVCASQKPKELLNFKTSWVRYGIMLLVAIVPLIMQPHKSAILLIGTVCVIIAMIGGANLRPLLLLIPVAALAFLALVFTSEYSIARITSFMDPFQDMEGSGWQAVQSLYAIGSGGLFGKGLGKSVQKALYIPEPQNDFIFSIICEELGFIGGLVVLTLFLLLIVRCVKISLEAPDKLGALIGIGVAVLITVQVVINIAVVTAMMPVTGMPLPFFSAGGTSLLFTMASMGLVLNISRKGKHKNLSENKK